MANMNASAKKFVNGDGFSNGMRGVGVEEAAAVGSDLLDGFLRGDRSLRDRLRRAFDRLDDRVRMEILDDALRAEEDAPSRIESGSRM